MVEAQEPEHIQMLRQSLRRFIAREAPSELVTRWDQEDQIAPDLLQHIGALGICGLTVPESMGGPGRDVLAMVAVIEELARASTALSSLYIMNTVYGCMNVAASGTAQQREKWLPDLLAGRTLFALGLSEPDVGGDLASVTTTARREGDTVVISGSKRWCTGAGIADFIYTLVRSGPAPERYQNLSFVIIPTAAPGVSMTSIKTMGCYGIPTNDVIFDDVEIPFDHVVGAEGGWNRGWSLLAGPALEAEKLQLPALALGIAHAAVEEAWEYSQQRQQFGKNICGHQAVRHQLAEARTRLLACRLMLQHAAELVQGEQDSAAETSMAKLFVAETAVEVVLSCQRILGAYGYAEGFQMERYVRDILVMPIFGGSSSIQKNNIANLLGLPKG
jgi:alkylation response protein AidB-like acyl-CoA dehydrogenase